MENYEKLYKEAIKRAKEMLFISTDTSQSITKETIEFIFPKLTESEDKNIREELIKYLKERAHSGFNQEVRICNDGIAWLEKQGEQKSSWNEEDEHYKNGLIGLVEDSKAGLPINLKGEAADKCIYWLKSFKDKVLPHQEWSKEDEKKIMWLVRLISTAGFRELDSDKMPCSRSELLDWLKSIKSNNWKPSEEQINELITAMNNATSPEGAGILESLYNEIIKL